jgi:hypothetical protein
VKSRPRRRDGWWGIAFVLGLLVYGAMVSLPTAAENGERIKAFYDTNRQVIVVQQILGLLLLVPLLGFVVVLNRRARAHTAGVPWLLVAGLLVAAAEAAASLPPLVLAAMTNPAPETAHTLTVVEDVADATLFMGIAFFSVLAALAEPAWVRGIGLVVAALTLVRAVASPLGVTALDAVAPIAFLAFVLLLSIRMLAIADGRAIG